MIKKSFLLVVVLLMVPMGANATFIIDPNEIIIEAELSGEQSFRKNFNGILPVGLGDPQSDGGITAYDGWRHDGLGTGIMLDWDIELVDGLWSYKYIITDAYGGALTKNVSHFIIGTSLDVDFSADFEDFFVSLESGILEEGTGYDIETGNQNAGGSGNPFMPQNMFGIKFTTIDEDWDGVVTFGFKSTRRPIWQPAYAKDGKDGEVFAVFYNTGFTAGKMNPDANDNTMDWVPGPDTEPFTTQGDPIPEPGTLLLLGSGLAGLVGYGRLRLRRKKK